MFIILPTAAHTSDINSSPTMCLQHCTARNTLLPIIYNSTDDKLRDHVFTRDASQGAASIHHLHTSPPMQMGRVELSSHWMRTQSINRRRMSCGRIGTAGADGVIMQLCGRDVRICEECATECVFSPRYFLSVTLLGGKLMIGGVRAALVSEQVRCTQRRER